MNKMRRRTRAEDKDTSICRIGLLDCVGCDGRDKTRIKLVTPGDDVKKLDRGHIETLRLVLG